MKKYKILEILNKVVYEHYDKTLTWFLCLLVCPFGWLFRL